MINFEERFKKLYYKQGRRYKEYTKHRSIPENQLYFLDGDEFVPYNTDSMSWYDYKGSPALGLWKVYPSGATRIGDYDMTDFRIELEKYHDIIVDAIDKALKACDGKWVSHSDIAREILNQIDKLNSERMGK